MKKIFCTECGKELICFEQQTETIGNDKATTYTFVCDDCNIDFEITTHEILEDERVVKNRKDAVNNLKEFYFAVENCAEKEIIKDIIADYEGLIDIRNRIASGTDKFTELYEEDHLTLDHILDYMQEFGKLIGVDLDT